MRLAQAYLQELQKAGSGAQYAPATGLTLAQTVGRIVNGALALLGVVFLVLLVYAGYLWMTARGEEESVKKAQDIIQASVIGLVIVLISYAVANFVVLRLIEATAG